MPFANVYLNNSTHGTISDSKGNFVLTNVPLGTVELVASFVGYKTEQQTLRLLSTPTQPINFRLKSGDQTLAGVTITAKRNEQVWQRQLQQFKNQLFGEPFGNQCVLLNPDVLHFEEANGYLKAVATEPLQIQNQALGYRLWFDLTYFHGEARQVYYGGSARFEEIDQKNKRQEKRFQRNRMRAYLGSTRHLMTSLIAGDYQEQNFLVYEEQDSTLSTYNSSASITLKQAIEQKLRPIRQSDLIQPGQLPFERMLVATKPLIVLYTKVLSPYSPYRDAPYAYTRIKLPTGSMQLLTNGWITVPNGVQMQGSLGQDRLSTLLPADWQPTQPDGVITPNGADLVRAIPTAKTAYYAEKAYLHTDRVQYVAGDTLWFNAYVVEATEHKPGALSQTLYVNLVDSTGEVQVRQLLRIDSTGQAPGSITLPAPLPGGTYQLLAYTNWMRNADNEFLFRKRIRIEAGTNFPVANTISQAVGLTVRLFPEGGNLVEGLPARVAFQALDAQGRSIAIKGVLTNQKGDTLSDFQSLHRGMGTFTLTPQPGQHYRILATSANGPLLPADLPEALPTGYALAVDNLTNSQALRVLIRSNQPEMGQLTLFAHVRGQICYQAQLDANKTEMLAAIPYDSIRQDGILHLTLFDADNHPVAERLAFIDRHRKLHIQIRSDKDTYQPRQPVTLHFSVSDSSGKPIPTKLSVAVTDTKQAAELEPGAPTLRSYLLLTSDLRGHIEAPDYYFESTEARTRQYLDYVMMTHGWRRFSWQALMSDSTTRPVYGLETGLSIGGRVRYEDDHSPAREAAMTGILKTIQRLVPMDIKTDKEGRFSLMNLLFSDTATVMIRPNGNRRIRLSLDEQTIPNFVSLPSLPVSGSAHLKAIINQALETQAVARQQLENGGRLLQAVNVKARKEGDQRDYRRIMYGTADATVVATDQMRSMPTVLRMIQGQVAGVTVSMNGDGSGLISIRNEPAAVMMDGTIIDNTVLATINPNDVEAIDVLKNPATYAIFGVRARGGVINILTRRGGDGEAQPNQVISKIAGYTVSREFYAPQYSTPPTQTTPADGRATLYWNPSLQTDANGKATVTFYNTDKETTIQTVAEGLSSGGLPGTGKVVYSVKK
ncbi:hypothetical protein GCM10027185_31210 [Spirosoma pulveris]